MPVRKYVQKEASLPPYEETKIAVSSSWSAAAVVDALPVREKNYDRREKINPGSTLHVTRRKDTLTAMWSLTAHLG